MKLKFRIKYTPRELRELTVKEITAELQRAKSFILFESSRITHSQFEELRRELREKKAVLRFVKNTLFAIACKNLGLPQELYAEKIIHGPTAIIYILTDDFIPALKAFTKLFGDSEGVKVKIAFLEKSIYSGEKIIEFSKIPSSEELQSKLLGILQKPVYSLYNALSYDLKKLVVALQQLSKKGGE